MRWTTEENMQFQDKGEAVVVNVWWSLCIKGLVFRWEMQSWKGDWIIRAFIRLANLLMISYSGVIRKWGLVGGSMSERGVSLKVISCPGHSVCVSLLPDLHYMNSDALPRPPAAWCSVSLWGLQHGASWLWPDASETVSQNDYFLPEFFFIGCVFQGQKADYFCDSVLWQTFPSKTRNMYVYSPQKGNP